MPPVCTCATAFTAPLLVRAFVPGAPGLSEAPLASRLLLRRTPTRRVRMALSSPEDLPSDVPDPTDKHIDMDLLRRRMADMDRKSRSSLDSNASHPASDPVIDLSSMSEGMAMEEVDDDEFLEHFENLRSLWVIVFTNIADGSDGVYSLTVAEENIVLAFQERSEAQRYALCLEAQEFPSPQVCELDSTELRDFCGESGFRLGFVPEGALISPPEESAIEDLDKWRGDPSKGSGRDHSTGLSEEDIEIMKKRLDTLFGQ